MNRESPIKNVSRKKIIIFAIVSALIIITAVLYVMNKGTDISGGGTPLTDESRASESDVQKMSQEDMEEAQKTAALAAITGKPVSGNVTQRPDYVSAIEWDVFQNVIRNQPRGNDIELATLVNKLLFFKKKEAWESSGMTAVQRRELARQLIEMLPFMTGGGYIHHDEARQLESSLNNALTSTTH